MQEFRPETRSLFTTAFFGVLFSATLHYGGGYRAWNYLSGIFLLIMFVSIYSILIQTKSKGKAEEYKAYALFAEKVADEKMSPARFHALGMAFPLVDVDFNDYEVEQFVRGTNVPLNFFIMYIKESRGGHVLPLRNLKKHTEIRHWHTITDLLYKRACIRKDAAGNHSHSWVGKWHTKLWQMFIKVEPVNMTNWQ